MNYSDEDYESTVARISEQLETVPVLLYMKGTPDAPLCGFSQRAVECLKQIKKPFAYVNVLQDEAIREHLPKFADWATFPQLWISGKLIGGADIIVEMFESGELAQVLNEVDFDWDGVDDEE